ncbi:MAG TPA: hypothetical protein VHB30_06590 [Solirubrobacteraceae bacterium]|nr:hypothetical protein [Solirubrobacteraceae bacterium]
MGAVAVLVVLSVGSDGWSDVGWLTAALAALAIAFGLLLPVLGAACRSPSLPILWIVLTLVWALGAAIALLADGVLVGALAAAVELAGAYYAMKDDRAPGVSDPPVDVRPAPPAA